MKLGKDAIHLREGDEGWVLGLRGAPGVCDVMWVDPTSRPCLSWRCEYSLPKGLVPHQACAADSLHILNGRIQQVVSSDISPLP